MTLKHCTIKEFSYFLIFSVKPHTVHTVSHLRAKLKRTKFIEND